MLLTATLLTAQFQIAFAFAKRESFNSQIDPVALTRLTETIHYPHHALSQKVEGRVILVALIDTFGSVEEVKCKESTDPIFIEPSKEAMVKMHFTPARENGKAVKVWYEQPLSFKLKGLPKRPVVLDGTPGLG